MLMISALMFHMWLMNLHEMWNEMMKYIGCDFVGFLETYLCWNRIYVDINALIFVMRLMNLHEFGSNEWRYELWHVVVIILVINWMWLAMVYGQFSLGVL